ncbi:recombinase family protein [uncultured Acetatifactor sp.]|uniref:recombinase family protein n=1 Tax=uncultured Acetatifactor sp. TaxID=1671927 RepID=UPI00261CE9FE|nr:recombinase family protein [uncultured Acetatifactor sp.]
MKDAVIYARYSSDKQDEASIEAQVRACREYAASKGYTVLEVYADEAISGKGSKTASRKAYQRMLRDVNKGIFDTILIHKYDRVARNLGEHVNLEKKLKDRRVELIAVAQDFGNTNEAKIMRTLMWSLSEYYLDNLSSEVKKGHRETALKALHNGGCAPFGYDVINQRYVINELEAGYVRKIFNAAANREGFTEIIAELAAAGITGKRGKPIKYTQIYEMLRNEKYTGTYIYTPQEEERREDRRSKPNAIRKENALPQIVSRAQFMEVQRIMTERKQTGKKAGYLCSGLVYCQCGAKMHGMRTTRKGHEYFRYYCSKKCGAHIVRMEEVDKAAVEYLHELLSPEKQDRIADALRQYQAGESNRAADFTRAIQRRINEKQGEYDALMKNLSTGALPAEVVADIGAQMQGIKEEIVRLQETTPPVDFTVDQIKAWLEVLKDSADEKAVHLLIERIDVTQKEAKTDFNMTSTLKSVLGEIGCGDRT